jgi:hypothetical protein
MEPGYPPDTLSIMEGMPGAPGQRTSTKTQMEPGFVQQMMAQADSLLSEESSMSDLICEFGTDVCFVMSSMMSQFDSELVDTQARVSNEVSEVISLYVKPTAVQFNLEAVEVFEFETQRVNNGEDDCLRGERLPLAGHVSNVVLLGRTLEDRGKMQQSDVGRKASLADTRECIEEPISIEDPKLEQVMPSRSGNNSASERRKKIKRQRRKRLKPSQDDTAKDLGPLDAALQQRSQQRQVPEPAVDDAMDFSKRESDDSADVPIRDAAERGS